ncbi:MAG: protocatechuate 3,4-dioxygenase subunit alpha [Variibacter sp.]
MPMEHRKETPSQTAGPFVHIGTMPAFAGLDMRKDENLHVLKDTSGRFHPIRIEGTIKDGGGDLVRDAMVEIWQADGDGRYNAAGFSGWGRAGTDLKTGLFAFETIKPGATALDDGRAQAPYILVSIFARGINLHLVTRLYFPDEEEANAPDPVLGAVAPSRRDTLIAKKTGDGAYRFDIALQGENETVFFDV